jgi:RHS repeat-associated protein
MPSIRLIELLTYLGKQLLAVQQSNQVNWVHQDPLVKSKRVTNSVGTVVSTVELDPRGGDTTRSSNEAFQPRRFTTYDRDGNASDEAMHRRYNRWHSRFDQPDPYGGSYDITNPQSFNRYSYVQNDPVNFVDPTGLCPEGTVAQPDARGEMQCVGVGVQSVDINISGGRLTGGVGGTSSGAIEIETSGNGPTEAEIIPRNSAPDVDDNRNRLADMLNNPNCRDFIINLLNGAAALTEDLYLSTDLLRLFDAVKVQRGFIYGDTIRRVSGYDGSTVSGSIIMATAQVELARPYLNVRTAQILASQARLEALSVLHELFHLAGRKGGYSDQVLASVVSNMPGQPAPTRDITQTRPASDYWGNALNAACAPKP